MSTVATPRRAGTQRLDAPAQTLTDRLLGAVPLLSVYVWLCMIYVVEAWGRVTPWLFTDELELTQLSRAIAKTGHAARRGVAHSPDSLYTYLIAPAWWLDSTHSAYDAVKYINVLTMTSVIFPTYFLARMVVGRWAALFAAAGAAAIPAVAYTGYIVEEPLAYPYTALCFFLIAKALLSLRRSWRSFAWPAAAVVACAVAPAVRTELVVLPVVLLMATFFAAWSSPWLAARRRTWTTGDWIGILTLAAGAVFVVSGWLSHHQPEWYAVTTYYKHRMFSLGLWAAGAFTIGLGVVPVIAGLAALVRPAGETPSREVRLFRSVAAAGLIGFGIYTAVKAAYLSTVFATRVEERNIIYIAPLLFVGTALVLERRRVNVFALLAATAFALYLVVTTPLQMDVQLYSDALGLAILQQANRYLLWTPQFAQWLLIAIAVGATAAIVALRFLSNRRRLALGSVAAIGVLVVAWNLTGEIAAAGGSDSISREQAHTLGEPYDWVDQVTHGRPTWYLGQGVADQTGEWMMEFWNHSIDYVGSLDGTIDGPGPTGAPNIAPGGKTYWTGDPSKPGREYEYAVEEWPCVDFAGALVRRHSYRAGGKVGGGRWRLIKLAIPNRFRSMCVGISPDGWTGPLDSGYYRFSSATKGHMEITVSRAKWGGPSDPSPIHVQVGTVRITKEREAALGRVTAQRDSTIDRLQTKTFELPVPGPAFAARVIVDRKFVPHELDPSNPDTRQLGAVVSYRFVPGPIRHAAHK